MLSAGYCRLFQLLVLLLRCCFRWQDDLADQDVGEDEAGQVGGPGGGGGGGAATKGR